MFTVHVHKQVLISDALTSSSYGSVGEQTMIYDGETPTPLDLDRHANV